MAKNDPLDEFLNIIKAIAIGILGFIIIRALLNF